MSLIDILLIVFMALLAASFFYQPAVAGPYYRHPSGWLVFICLLLLAVGARLPLHLS
jgi:hypothetical protein